MFYGIVIYMYFKDNRQHNKPHIHARYQGNEAVLLFLTVNYLKVTFQTRK
jgi:hypothetical protein